MAFNVKETAGCYGLSNVERSVLNLATNVAFCFGVGGRDLMALSFEGFVGILTSVEVNGLSPFAYGLMIMQESYPFSQGRFVVAMEEVVGI